MSPLNDAHFTANLMANLAVFIWFYVLQLSPLLLLNLFYCTCLVFKWCKPP